MSNWRIPRAMMMCSALAGGVMVGIAGLTVMASTCSLALDRSQIPDTGGKTFLDSGAADIIARSQPSIDIELTFEDQSADITPETESALEKLGRALTSKELKGNIYLIAAHTDASESEDLNQALSEQRAIAVKAFLHDRFGIADDRLVTVGYGASRLKNKNDPLASENNRIEIINLGKDAGNGKNGRSAVPPGH